MFSIKYLIERNRPFQGAPRRNPCFPVLTLGLLFVLLSVPALAGNLYYYYEQLNDCEKEIYDLLVSNIETLSENVPATMEKDLTKEQCEELLQSLDVAATTLLQDHSEIFWCSGWSYHFVRENTEVSNVFHYTFSFSLTPHFNWTAAGGRSIQRDMETLQRSVSSLAKKIREIGDTRYHQLLWLHDWLTQNNTYNSAAAEAGPDEDSVPWTPQSGLDRNLSPVCEGYSRAFQLICQELEIPCILVAGGEHMWNYVQMEDEKWYAVDVTYDDPIYKVDGVLQTALISGKETRDYFLIGERIFNDHKSDDSFVYPVLSSTDYHSTVTKTPLAYPSTQMVKINGTPVQFQMYALRDKNGYETNYIKLRDLALALNGSSARFAVTWNHRTQTVDITPGVSYQPDGSEMWTPFSDARTYGPADGKTRIHRIPFQLDAILLQDDAGNGYTYYKLRDLGTVLGFHVGWSTEQGVYVNTPF